MPGKVCHLVDVKCQVFKVVQGEGVIKSVQSTAFRWLARYLFSRMRKRLDLVRLLLELASGGLKNMNPRTRMHNDKLIMDSNDEQPHVLYDGDIYVCDLTHLTHYWYFGSTCVDCGATVDTSPGYANDL